MRVDIDVGAHHNPFMGDAGPVLDAINSVVSTGAILIGGTFAYFKFVRGRTFRCNIDIHITTRQADNLGRPAIVLEVEIVNSGTVAIAFPDYGRQQAEINLLEPTLWASKKNLGNVDWSKCESLPRVSLFTVNGFRRGDVFLEPGEVYSNEILVEMPRADWGACQINAVIEAHSWTARATIKAWFLRMTSLQPSLFEFSRTKVVTQTNGF